jgi:tripartite-type tricarboxylate transporter receptor subunit TctC
MIGGQLSSAFLDAGSSKQHLPKFKLLGVTGSERLTWLPQVPTLKEQGLQSYEPMGWFALLLPAATPKAVIDKFSAESQRILKLPDVREKIELIPTVREAAVELVFDPPWNQGMMSDAARLQTGMY